MIIAALIRGYRIRNHTRVPESAQRLGLVSSGSVSLGIYRTLTVSLSPIYTHLSSYYTTHMSRPRSRSTSSLPANLMASWSIHSYSASRTENAVQGPPFEVPYLNTEQVSQQPTEEMPPLGVLASNAMTFMPGPESPPRSHTAPPASVDTTFTQNIGLPVSAYPQQLLAFPIMSLSSLMDNLSSTQLPLSDLISDTDWELQHPPLRAPSVDSTSDPGYIMTQPSFVDNYPLTPPSMGFTSISDFDSEAHSISSFENEYGPGLWNNMFNYWISVDRPRRYVGFYPLLYLCSPHSVLPCLFI